MKNVEVKIREFAQKWINTPESEFDFDFDGWSSSDYIQCLAELLEEEFNGESDLDMWDIAVEELDKLQQ